MGGPVTVPAPLAVLAVSSSTGVMSVGLVPPARPAADGGDAGSGPVVLTAEIDTERRHAEELVPRIQDLLDEAGCVVGDLDLLAVDVGPGRFTGLRVGVATVRALAFATGLPVVGATSLEILAAGASSPVVTAVVDARRQEVYQQNFVNGMPDGEARVGLPEDLAPLARGVVLGDGVDRYPEPYRGLDGVEVLADRHPRAADLVSLAKGRAARPGTEIEPLYLRDPDAKANIRTRPEAATT